MLKNVRQTKVSIKDSIMEVMKAKGSGDLETMISHFKLETALGRDVVMEVIKDMIQVELIEIKDGRLRLHQSQEPEATGQ